MRRVRTLDAALTWALSIALSGAFLLAGVPKVLGTQTVFIRAAALHTSPAPIRVGIGVLEIAGAIGLLIPRFATAAAIGLAMLMIPATQTMYSTGEPGLWVPPLLMVLLLVVAWRRNVAAVSARYHGFADSPHPLLHDGVIAGLIGAVTIAVWFFILDSVAGRPFYTPWTLGRLLLSPFGAVPPVEDAVTCVIFYTVFHFVAFMIVGLAVSVVVAAARREPSVLFAFVILFVMWEVGTYGVVALLEVGTLLGPTAWLQIMVSNLLAAAAMALYFVKKHPELREEFRHSLDAEAGAPTESPPPPAPQVPLGRPGRR